MIRSKLPPHELLMSGLIAVSVSGMDSFSLHAGRPFGGCSILYRKCLSLTISRLPTSSNRYCAIKVRTSDGKSYLMFCVYMPYDRHPSPLLITLILSVRYVGLLMLIPTLEFSLLVTSM